MKIERIKQYFVDLKNLIWLFKWYILANIIIPLMMLHEYFFPPVADDPIFGQGVGQPWNYASQELYLKSVKFGMIISILVFLLGTSNMRNHPKIAKLIFLSPWLLSLWYMLFGE